MYIRSCQTMIRTMRRNVAKQDKVRLSCYNGVFQVVLVVKNLPTKARDMRLRFDPWVGKIPWRMAWQPTPVVLPGESHGHRSLEGYRPQGHKESNTTEATQNAHTQVAIVKKSDTNSVAQRRQKFISLSLNSLRSVFQVGGKLGLTCQLRIQFLCCFPMPECLIVICIMVIGWPLRLRQKEEE